MPRGRGIRDNWFFRRFPPILCVIGAAAALWAWQSDTASWAERIWVFSALMSGSAATWGLFRAFRMKRWVRGEADRHPGGDYTSAHQVAVTHIVMHAALIVAQVALLQFGFFAAVTAPANPGKPITPVGLDLTGTLIMVAIALTFLNYFLLWRQDRLIENVIEIGGD